MAKLWSNGYFGWAVFPAQDSLNCCKIPQSLEALTFIVDFLWFPPLRPSLFVSGCFRLNKQLFPLWASLVLQGWTGTWLWSTKLWFMSNFSYTCDLKCQSLTMSPRWRSPLISFTSINFVLQSVNRYYSCHTMRQSLCFLFISTHPTSKFKVLCSLWYLQKSLFDTVQAPFSPSLPFSRPQGSATRQNFLTNSPTPRALLYKSEVRVACCPKVVAQGLGSLKFRVRSCFVSRRLLCCKLL